jgi:hypothetical protein
MPTTSKSSEICILFAMTSIMRSLFFCCCTASFKDFIVAKFRPCKKV